MEGGLGREGYRLGAVRLTTRTSEHVKPVEPKQAETPAIQAETQMEVMKARLRAPMRDYAEKRGPTANRGRPLPIYRELGIQASDPIAAQATFELVLELSEGREADLTWISPLIHFTHDFEGNLGGSYGGLAGTASPWIQPVFFLACRTLKANESNEWNGTENVWVEELLAMMDADDAAKTFWEQLDQVLGGQNRYFTPDVIWNRKQGR